MRSALVIGLLLAPGATPAFAKPKPSKTLTVERIYSEPSLSGYLTKGIEWSPDGRRISYLERKGSSTEMWTMDATTGQRKVLVKAGVLEEVMQPEKTSAIQSTGLGRVQAENYLWSPSGDALLFVGSNNLVLLDLKTMAPKPLVRSDAEIADPKFSPDGKWVSFVRGSNLWLAEVATGETRALTAGGSEEILKGQLDWVYPEELDATTAYWWSPDSSKIAYYEMDERPVTRYPIMDMSSPVGAVEYTRFPQAGEANPIVRLGVVSVDGGESKWMDAGADTDVYLARVVWLRDSRRIAIERLNRAQNRLDLLFCDAATGASETILTETDKYWINLADDLYFFSDGKRFLWSSERTGFRHYYLYDLSGRQLAQLTSGEWGITGNGGFGPGSASQPAVDEARGFIYFLSNKDDIRGTELYRLAVGDKSITRLTREDGAHEVLIAPDASAFVDTYSNAMTPPRQELFRMDATRVAAIDENRVRDLSEYRLSPVEFLDLAASDGTRLCASIIRPPDFEASRKYPVLVHVYGGPHVQNVRNEWESSDFLWLEMMAEKGYIIFTLDNRGSFERGHAFETPIYHQLGKVELEDQLAGVKYLKSLAYVDAARIGIFGWSYGGTMTLEAMFNAPDVFKAGVSVAPVSDWRLYDTIYTERYMGRPQDNPRGYENSSPVNQAARLRGKLMVVHATGDDNVHFANTSELINELILAGKYPSSLQIFPGRGHSIADLPARIELYRGITDFLLNNL
ncbi:MAG TPA: DPP IV N-terminal domain-containing protein [Candidatus Acidoferrales bacterium]|nr:DPP IV N-terminal domain-containing protein [Candidatus Acidoferrales bacterium]